MPFDSNGVFSRVMNWTSDQQNGIAIECGRHDAEDNNFAEGFNETFCRDGRAAATGNFNLGNHKIQNLAEGIAATDAVTKGQLDASSAAGVSLNTPQTITGSKTFLGGYQNVKLKVNSSAADAYTDLTFLNYDNSLSGYIRAFNNGNISFITSQNIKLSHAPTDDNTTSTQVDTVGARNTKLGDYVTLGTEQTITGNKTFTAAITFDSYIRFMNNAQSYRHIYSDNSAITKGTAPSANTGYDYLFRDSANSNIVGFGGWYNTNGNIYAALYAYNPTAGSTTHADLRVGNYASGRADVVFETPTGVANSCLDGETNSTTSNMVALKGWVNNPATATNVVHRSGNETIGGVKRFSENILTDINATRNVAPSAAQYGGIGIRDNANNLFASMVAAMDTNKNASAFLRVFNPKNTSSSDATYMTLHYDADGATYVTAPASDKNGSIVTTTGKTKAANGYYELGNGLIVQWGKVASDGNTYVTITYPKTFSSATSYSITATQRSKSSSLASSSAVSIYNPTATSVKVASRAITESSDNDYFYWIAIGY